MGRAYVEQWPCGEESEQDGGDFQNGNSWFREPQSVEAVSNMTEEEKKAIAFGETAYRAMRDNRWKKK